MIKLPTLRALTRELRDLHEAWAHPYVGGAYVALAPVDDWGDHYALTPWRVLTGHETVEYSSWCAVREYIPGDGDSFDAVAAARRLLAAAKEANDMIRRREL